MNIFAAQKLAYNKHSDGFHRIFNAYLRKYYNIYMGFDIIAFDQLIGAGDESVQDVVLKKYGQEALDMVLDLVHGIDANGTRYVPKEETV